MEKSGETVEFVYNENDLRVQKTATSTGVTQYILHGKNVVHMTQGSNELHFFYDAQNKPAVVVYNGVPYSYVKNLQGDIVAILDSNNAAVVNYVYDAWGRPISCSGTMANTLGKINPFRYRGYVYDEETGMYYLRSRYYHSAWGRFVNADRIVKGNIFCYCNNMPLGAFDPDGKDIVPLQKNIVLEDPIEVFTYLMRKNVDKDYQVTIDITNNPAYRIKKTGIEVETWYVKSTSERILEVNQFIDDSSREIGLTVGYIAAFVGVRFGVNIDPYAVADWIDVGINTKAVITTIIPLENIINDDSGHNHTKYILTIEGAGVFKQTDTYCLTICDDGIHEPQYFHAPDPSLP